MKRTSYLLFILLSFGIITCEEVKLQADDVCTSAHSSGDGNCCICESGSELCISACPAGFSFLLTSYPSCVYTSTGTTPGYTTTLATGNTTSATEATMAENQTMTTNLAVETESTMSTAANGSDASNATTEVTTHATTTVTMPDIVVIETAICVLQCPDGYFTNSSYFCVQCHELCMTCNGPSVQNCTECKYVMDDGECSRIHDTPDSNLPVIIGGAVGGAVVVAIIIVVVACCVCRRRHKDDANSLNMVEIPSIEQAVDQVDQVDECPSPKRPMDHTYGNMPEKAKDFSQQLLFKHDEKSRYTVDPTANMNNGDVTPENPYGNEMTIRMQKHEQESKQTLKRSPTNETAVLDELGTPPPVPDEGSEVKFDEREPDEIYQNQDTTAVNHSSVQEPDEIYENTLVQTTNDNSSSSTDLYQAPKSNAPLSSNEDAVGYPVPVTGDETETPEPTEDYGNFSMFKLNAAGSDQINPTLDNVDPNSPSELYGNVGPGSWNIEGEVGVPTNNDVGDQSSELYDNVGGELGEVNSGYVGNEDSPVYGNVGDVRHSTSDDDPIYGNVVP